MRGKITKVIKKILPLFILFITLFNFIVPNYVYADVWEDLGGVLVKATKQLLCAIGDTIMRLLMNTFTPNAGRITPMFSDYVFTYSPGAIFSGQIALLNINFFHSTQQQYINTQHTLRYAKQDVNSNGTIVERP